MNKLRKKILLLFSGLILVIIGLQLALPLKAVEEESPISDDDVKEKIKERLEEVVDKGLDKVKGVMEDEEKNKLYAWVGKAPTTGSDKILVETLEGLKEANIASNAAIYKLIPGESKKSIDPEDIKPGSFAIVMGPKESEELILAKRILVMEEAPASVKREVIGGKVTEVDEDEITIQKNGDTLDLTIGKKVDLKIEGIKKPSTEDIQINDYLTAIVVLDKSENIEEIKAVLIVPGETNPQAEENEVETETEEEATPTAETEEE